MQGDLESGIDEGIKVLSSISFAPSEASNGRVEGRELVGAVEWKIEEHNNRNLPDDDRWFRKRGLVNSGEERWSSKSEKAADISDDVKELREQEVRNGKEQSDDIDVQQSFLAHLSLRVKRRYQGPKTVFNSSSRAGRGARVHLRHLLPEG